MNKDPDILISTGDNYNSSTLFHDLITKMNALGFDIGKGPYIPVKINKANVKGRICLENESFETDLDLVGLIERARFGFLPLGMAAYYGMSRLIDSRNVIRLFIKDLLFLRATVARLSPFGL